MGSFASDVCNHVNNGHHTIFSAPRIPLVQGELTCCQRRLDVDSCVARHLGFSLCVVLFPSNLNALGLLVHAWNPLRQLRVPGQPDSLFLKRRCFSPLLEVYEGWARKGRTPRPGPAATAPSLSPGVSAQVTLPPNRRAGSFMT